LSSAGRGIFLTEILDNRALYPDTHVISIKRPAGFPDTEPGGFISIRAVENTTPLLLRPFSIMWQDDEHIEILVKVVGPGSEALSKKRTKEPVKILGPLGGRTFPAPSQRPVILIAGGTGIAPIAYAIKKWSAAGVSNAVLIYGAASSVGIARDILDEGVIESHYATLDGSLGFEGDAVELFKSLALDNSLPEGDIYSCGPRGMVRALCDAVAGLGGMYKGRFAHHYTSLEAVMACGLGACRGCTVPLKGDGESALKTVCSDGPVFDAEEIDWEGWTW